MDLNPINFENTRKTLDELQIHFRNYSSSVAQRGKKWENYSYNYEKFIKNQNSNRIKLNIGGYFFEVSADILYSFPSSNLKALIEKNTILNENNKSLPVFIDRPGKNFDFILNYLRTAIIDENLELPLCKKLGILEEANFYGLTDIIEKLHLFDKVVFSPSHEHPVHLTKITDSFTCRGPVFYNNDKECLQKDKSIKYFYKCTEINCKFLPAEYCVGCVQRQDKHYFHSKHGCQLYIEKTMPDWACDARDLKDRCLSGFNDFYIAKKELMFYCKQHDWGICERCYIHYK